MIFFYLNAHSKIPFKSYKKLCRLINIEPYNRPYIEINNKIKKIKKIGRVGKDLAELIGILAGDGHISLKKYEVSVSGHLKLDKEFIKFYVCNLFKKIFGIAPKIKIYVPNNNIRCVINSKKLVEYLTKKFKLPKGKKKGKLHIPLLIKKDIKLLNHYIRGLFDTDGSIYSRRKKDLVVSIISGDLRFLKEVKEGLIILGYHPSTSTKNLYIYRQNEVKKFFSEIKPSNKKHLNRYNYFYQKFSLNL